MAPAVQECVVWIGREHTCSPSSPGAKQGVTVEEELMFALLFSSSGAAKVNRGRGGIDGGLMEEVAFKLGGEF